MRESDLRVLKGVSIANIVIAALALASYLVAAIVLALGGSVVNDPELIAYLANDPSFSTTINGEHYDLSQSDVSGIMALVFGLLGAFVGWLAICSVVCLIAGILGLRASNRPDKLGAAFGWSVAGAVLSFLGGALPVVSTILFVVAAVYASRAKRAPEQQAYNPYAFGQPQAPYGQAPYGQPYQQPPFAAQPPYQGQQAPFAQSQPQQPYANPPESTDEATGSQPTDVEKK